MSIPDTGGEINSIAERSLLGTTLTDHSIVGDMLATVRRDHYHTFAHGLIHATIADLHSRNITPDILTVGQVIAEKGLMAEIGGAYYLADLIDSRSVAREWQHWAGIITDHAQRRDLMRLADAIRARAGDMGESPGDVIRAAETQLRGIETGGKAMGAERFTIGELIRRYPRLDPVAIDGLLRERETGNIISYSKIGKSWLGYGIALSKATGRPWLDRFEIPQGRTIIFDNELRRPTIAGRIRTVADAMSIPFRDYEDAIEILPLRGNLRDIHEIEPEMRKSKGFGLIIIDAKYRMIPPGANENDNAAETAFYNRLDQYAEMTGAAIICIHHASKGDQAGKRVTDVGAGAGAQSRAADCHLVLREHEDDATVVLEAAVRSFAPVKPVALRWEFPLWTACDADPALLRGRAARPGEKKEKQDSEGMGKILDILMAGPSSVRELRRSTGMGAERVERLLGILVSEVRATYTEITKRGNVTHEYRLTTAI